jgi:flavin reductase (DIM6/NTAB) family NADH-FMN oxidoreductase RutF
MLAQHFLAGMRKVAGAVCVITTVGQQGERRGLTATAVCSLSAAPPSLIVCVNQKTWVAQLVANAGVFAVNVLSNFQEDVARAFAAQTDLTAEDRFSVGSWETRITGAPVATDALASFECKLEREIAHTTHTILIGQVVGTNLGDGHSLVYLDGNFSMVAGSIPA